jgi:hypothetical protein
VKAKHKVILVSSLLAVALLTTWMQSTQSDESRSYSASTYSTRPGGYKALYDLFAELQLPVERMRTRYSRLESRKGVLVVVDPHEVPFGGREIKKLNKWIRAGNRLLIFSGGPRYYPKPPAFLDSRPIPQMTRRLKGHSLAKKLGLKSTSSQTAARTVVDVSSLDLYGVHAISASRFSRWVKMPSGWTSLIRDKAGSVIAQKTLGKGEIIAISDASIAANRNVGTSQNARLITALALDKGRPRSILFDEYHHGYSLAESFWTFVGSSVFGWILLQVFVGLFLFFYGRRAAYSGRFRTLERPVGRSSLEYVESMAHVLESSKANRLALEALLQRFLAKLSRRSGVPLKRLEQRSGKQLPLQDAAAWRLVEECRSAMKSDAGSREVLSVARKLMALQASLKGRGSTRRVA